MTYDWNATWTWALVDLSGYNQVAHPALLENWPVLLLRNHTSCRHKNNRFYDPIDANFETRKNGFYRLSSEMVAQKPP